MHVSNSLSSCWLGVKLLTGLSKIQSSCKSLSAKNSINRSLHSNLLISVFGSIRFCLGTGVNLSPKSVNTCNAFLSICFVERFTTLGFLSFGVLCIDALGLVVFLFVELSC